MPRPPASASSSTPGRRSSFLPGETESPTLEGGRAGPLQFGAPPTLSHSSSPSRLLAEYGLARPDISSTLESRKAMGRIFESTVRDKPMRPRAGAFGGPADAACQSTLSFPPLILQWDPAPLHPKRGLFEYVWSNKNSALRESPLQRYATWPVPAHAFVRPRQISPTTSQQSSTRPQERLPRGSSSKTPVSVSHTVCGTGSV